MDEKQQKEFEELAQEYTDILHRMNDFITFNELDNDKIWDEANQYYDEDCSRKLNR